MRNKNWNKENTFIPLIVRPSKIYLIDVCLKVWGFFLEVNILSESINKFYADISQQFSAKTAKNIGLYTDKFMYH